MLQRVYFHFDYIILYVYHLSVDNLEDKNIHYKKKSLYV